MGLFSPHKRRPNQFRYKPRYFDPEKEMREQRRRELCGQSSETDDMEYEPGMYLRTQRDARNEGSLVQRRKGGAMRGMIIMAVAMFVIVIGAMGLFQRLLTKPERKPVTKFEQAQIEQETFSSDTPIIVVPNDGADSVTLEIPKFEE